MSGPIEESTSKDLFEMSNVRNVLVHRSGIADRRFHERCPWRPETKGIRLTVSHTDYQRYLAAIHLYLFELLVRDLIRQGRSRSEAVATLGAGRKPR
jgi:hypothetical protein